MFTPNPNILNIGDRIELTQRLVMWHGTYEVGHQFVIVGNSERGVDLRDDHGNEVGECLFIQKTFKKVEWDKAPVSNPNTDDTITNKELLSDLSNVRLLLLVALNAGTDTKGKAATTSVEACVQFVCKYSNLIELNARQALNG